MSNGKKETVYAFGFSVLSKIFTYFLLLLLANFFTKDDFGRASFVIALYSLTLTFAFPGASNLFTVWYMKKKDYHSVFYFLSILTFIAFAAWIFVSFSYSWILPFALVLPFVFIYNISTALLRVNYKYDTIQLSGALFILITILALFLLTSAGKMGIILAYSIGYLAISIWFIILTRNELKEIAAKIKLKWRAIKDYIAKGLAVAVVGLAFSFLGWIDSTILGLLSTFENVAKYNIAGPIANVLTLIPLSLGAFLLTRTSELKNKRISINVLNKALRVSYIFSMVSAIALVSLLPLIFKLFFPGYIGNEIYVMILSIGILLYGIYFLLFAHTMGELNPEKALLPIGLAAVVNIVLDILLIPSYGLYGITAATTFAHFVAFLLLSAKTNLLRENLKFLVPIVLVPAAYLLGYFGLLLIPVGILIIAEIGLIKKGDFSVIKETLEDILRIKKKN